MRVVLAFASVALVALLGGSAATQTLPVTAVSARHDVERQHAQAAQLTRLASKVVASRETLWNCQDVLGMKRTRAEEWAWSLPESIPYRGWVLEQWQSKASSCLTVQKQRTIPLINDWVTAVRWVQRIYPGTADWMLYISDREGGHGPWVWYGGRHWSGYHVGGDFLGADTVGGWMQFRYSTFAPYWRGAIKDLRARGYILPDIPMPPEGGPTQYAGWLSPLAQALTAGYMKYYGREGCHWCI